MDQPHLAHAPPFFQPLLALEFVRHRLEELVEVEQLDAVLLKIEDRIAAHDRAEMSARPADDVLSKYLRT